MKYAARIFLVFLVLFLISEISYQVTAGALAEQEIKGEVPEAYLKGLDYNETRLEAGAKLLFETEDAELEISQWIDISPARTAGMTKSEFQEYLDRYQLAEEMVSIGLTDMRVESFERHKAVVLVSYETPDAKRYQYWCIAKDGVIRVYDNQKEHLVLEQLFIRTRFTPSERRQLTEGIYLKNYDELIGFLGTLQGAGRPANEDRKI